MKTLTISLSSKKILSHLTQAAILISFDISDIEQTPIQA